jgi:hypothetical protein
MTVGAVSPPIVYAGNAVTTIFPIPFNWATSTDITVSIVDIAGAALAIGYTITGFSGAGNMVAASAPPVGSVITIGRTTGRLQQTNFLPGDVFPAGSFTAGLDRAMLIDQEQDNKIKDTSNRALVVPFGEVSTPLPSAADRVGKFLVGLIGGGFAFASGTGADAGLRTDIATSAGAGLMGWLQAGIGAILRSVQSKLRETVSVYDFGAVGDGATDDTLAFTKAIAYLKSIGGGELFVPPGTFKTTASISITSPAIAIRGTGRASIIKGYGSFDTLSIDGTTSGGLTAMYRNNISNLLFTETNKTGGYCFSAYAFAQARFRDLHFEDPFNGMKLNYYNDVVVDEVVFQGAIRQEGGQRLLLTSPTNTTSDVITIRNLGMGGRGPYPGAPGAHSAHGLIIDGWCNTVTVIKSYAVLIEGIAYWVRNSIGATQPPGFLSLWGIESDFCAGQGLYLQNCTGARITDPQLEASWANHGILIGAGAINIDIKGGQVNDNGAEGINTSGTRVTITGINIYSNSNSARGGTTGSAAGIYINSAARHTVINGVQSGPGSAANTQTTGLTIDSNTNNLVVTGNNFMSVAAGIINPTGTSATRIVANNLG